MSKSVKVLMVFMVDYVLLFCLIKTFNPFNLSIANFLSIGIGMLIFRQTQ
jgi:hypothetical protein